MRNQIILYFILNIIIAVYYLYVPFKNKAKINPAGYVSLFMFNLVFGIFTILLVGCGNNEKSK